MGRHAAGPIDHPSPRPRRTLDRPLTLAELRARLEAERAEMREAEAMRQAAAVAVMERTADLTAELSALFDTGVIPAVRDVEPPLTDFGRPVHPPSDWRPNRFVSSDPINPVGPGQRPDRRRDTDYNRPHPYPVARPPITVDEPAESITGVIQRIVEDESITGTIQRIVEEDEARPKAPPAAKPPAPTRRVQHRSEPAPRKPIVVRTPVLLAAALAAAVVTADQVGVFHTTASSASAPKDQVAGSSTTPSPTLSAVPLLATGTDQRVSRAVRHFGLDSTATTTSAKPAKRKPTSTMKPGQTVPGKWVRPNNGPYNSCFCSRWGVMHYGIDIAGKLGSPIYAVGDGVVVDAGPAEGFGNWVVIRHSNGDVSIYGHMRYYYVQVGEKVKAGQEIAVVGEEGEATGPHLHFGVRQGGVDGPYIDPIPWLTARGVSVGPYEPWE